MLLGKFHCLFLIAKNADRSDCFCFRFVSFLNDYTCKRERGQIQQPSSPRKDEIEATKRTKNFGTKPSYSPSLISFVLPKKNKPGDFKGKAFFLFPANWGIFKVTQNPLLPPFLGDGA